MNEWVDSIIVGNIYQVSVHVIQATLVSWGVDEWFLEIEGVDFSIYVQANFSIMMIIKLKKILNYQVLSKVSFVFDLSREVKKLI